MNRLQTMEWATLIQQRWNDIPEAWKKAFFWSLLVNIIFYFYDLAQFPLGDHDVGYMDGISLLSGGRAGRWFLPFLHLLDGHVQIPVYTTLLAMASLIIAGMTAVRLWKPDAGFLPLFAGAVIVSCHPAVTDFHYYHYMVLGFTSGALFIVLSIHCSLRTTWKQPWRVAGAIILATIGLGSYQSAVMTWTTCMCGYLLIQLAAWDGDMTQLRNRLLTIVMPTVCMLAACLLYSLSLALYPLVGLSLNLYQFETTAGTDLFARLGELVRISWTHLFLPQGFVSGWFKGLFLLAMPLAFMALCASTRATAHNMLRKGLLLLFFLLLPLATKSQFIISSSNQWHLYRFMAYGDTYLYAFLLVILLTGSVVIFRNLGLLLLVLAIPCMGVNLLDQQVRHVRSVEHDMAVLNRVIGRIEALPDYDPARTYNLVQFGRTLPYLGSSPEMGTHNPLVGRTVSQTWNPGFELWHLSRYLKLGTRMNEYGTDKALLTKALSFAQGRQAFPAQGSIGIVDETIVLVFDEAAVQTAEQLMNENSK